ncbi:MAG: ribosome silencing factor [Erysipelotrichaceae bacterium]|nr:ribosome silencing factor [Erysipelotrichaceae bacterium]
MNSDKYTKGILQLLEETKAEDIQIIDVRDKTPFSEYYILVTATNPRQMNALKEAVVEKIETLKGKINHVEGNENSGWILVDAYHVIINIFSKEERERIGLEQILSRR